MFVDLTRSYRWPEFDRDREAVIQRARDAGVRAILNVGTGDPHSGALERAILLTEAHHDVFAAVGTHPHDARLFDDKAAERLTRLVRQAARSSPGERSVSTSLRQFAAGESARGISPPAQTGSGRKLPVIIHTREAEEETIEILRAEWPLQICLASCMFQRARGWQRKLWNWSGNLILGILTFKKAQDLRDIARQVPSEQLLIETDCPYLAPVPFRAKETSRRMSWKWHAALRR